MRNVASSISTSLNSAVTDFEPLENLTIQHLQLHFYFLVVVQRIIRLYDSCFSVCTFFCTVRRDTQHRQNTALQAKSHVSSISHYLLNLVPLSCATFPPLDALAEKKWYT